MKSSKLFFTIVCASVLFAGCNGGNDKPVNNELDSVEGQIPIVAWHGLSSRLVTEERYREMADAGFTIDLPWDLALTAPISVEAYFKSLDAAQAAGIKVMVSIKVLEVFSAEDITRLKAHPALWGYFVKDEPQASEFPELNNSVKAVQAVDSEHPFYINLNEMHNAKVDDNATRYRNEYIGAFYNAIPSIPFLSFDKYPIQQKGSNPRTVASDFYTNLEVVSAVAKEKGIPFWAFALSTAHSAYPVPTLDDLRLQVYSDLAYGAQCIQYFTYLTPTPYGTADFHEGPLDDIAGNKTPTYDLVKAMNAEIKALSKVFLGSKMVWAAHTKEVPKGCKEFNKSQLPAVIKDVEVSTGGALISLLERGKDNFLVIVNHDINKDAVVKVSAEASVRLIEKDGTVVDADGESHLLMPGDVLVHFWKTKE